LASQDRDRIATSHSPQQRANGRSSDIHCVAQETFDNRGTIATKPFQFLFADLGYPGVVAGPPEYGFSKSVDLFTPFRIVFIHRLGANKKDVDIAVKPSVSPCCRPEHGGMQRKRVPRLDRFPQSLKKRKAKIRHLGNWGSGKVVPVQRVGLRASYLLTKYETVRH